MKLILLALVIALVYSQNLNCPVGYTAYNNQTCAQCPFYCKTCSNLTTCTTCENGFTIQNFTVQDPPGYAMLCSTKTCGNNQNYNINYARCELGCPQGCKFCSPIDRDNCVECLQGYYYDYHTRSCGAAPDYYIATMTMTILIFVVLLIDTGLVALKMRKR